MGAMLAVLLLVFCAQTARAQGGDSGRGGQVYDANCAVCHGPDGQGRVGADLSQDFPAIDLTVFLRQTVAAGVPGTRMPAWSQSNGGPLTDSEIDDVVAFVETLGGDAARPRRRRRRSRRLPFRRRSGRWATPAAARRSTTPTARFVTATAGRGGWARR